MLKKNKLWIIMLVTVAMMALTLTGCDGGEEKDSDKAEKEVEEKEMVEEIDYLSMQTTIAYSSGDDMDWAYGNQRKEFPGDEACYIRLGTTAISEKSKGVGTEIVITYTFTGAENCKIEISDGIVEQIDSGDENVLIFTKTTTASKEKDAVEDVVIFKYMPYGADSVVVEVDYDDQIKSKYDLRNTVYFEKVPDSQRGTH